MTKWMKIALRNILKNRRRSFVTLLAIAMGFASVSLFRGYTHNTYHGLRESAVRGEGLGHLTIYKQGWIENGKTDPDKYMFTQAEQKQITDIVEKEDDVILATPQLWISGLVSNGQTSTIFLANGVIPGDDRTIKGAWAAFRPVKGEGLNGKKEYGVEMAEDLARHLKMKPGDNGVVMATTLDGQMNALDIEIAGVYDSGSDATNDKYMRVPFKFAQSLYETEKADRIIVLLKDWKKTDLVLERLTANLSNAGLNCEIKPWYKLSLFYSKVKGMFDMIFMFIFCIVFIIVVMSVVNTMGMAVLERTREIGTLRALGLKRRGVSLLFAVEGAMLGLLGTIVGILINIGVWAAIRIAQPSYIPPGVSTPVPLIVNLVPQSMMILMIFLIFLSLIAAILPARRAARQNVVDALGHV
ncbi:MAG TPA: FtsX-like permease family protein [Desulfobacteraceae bacterium]|nr:FtsX-like permease family protein [Desulfobacteraceae bacterium]HPJ67145.1 FtsX-like permease family protein [Desulfobacteraceae bacterium]HPQ29337.1 FtsX-like permease family protein [Desulfobacteraceae bacterium]